MPQGTRKSGFRPDDPLEVVGGDRVFLRLEIQDYIEAIRGRPITTRRAQSFVNSWSVETTSKGTRWMGTGFTTQANSLWARCEQQVYGAAESSRINGASGGRPKKDAPILRGFTSVSGGDLRK